MPTLNKNFWIAFALGVAAVYVWGYVGARLMTMKGKGSKSGS